MSAKEDSGRSTPNTLSTDGVEVLSDSIFNSDVEQNWSVIFTDDNNSTDHDLRSNYSSSEADDDIPDRNPRVAVSRFSNETLEAKSIEGSNIESASISTLKGDKSEQSLQIPNLVHDVTDPVAEKDESNLTYAPAIPKDEKESPWSSLKVYFVYIVLGLLVLERSLDLFGFNIIPLGNLRSTVQPVPYLGSQSDEESCTVLTVIRYTTTTQTLFKPGKTITVETELPAETIFKARGDLTEVNSWSLAKALYDNFVSSTELVSKNLYGQFKEHSLKAMVVASEIEEHLHKKSGILVKRFGEFATDYSKSAATQLNKLKFVEYHSYFQKLKDSEAVVRAKSMSFRFWDSSVNTLKTLRDSEMTRNVEHFGKESLKSVYDFTQVVDCTLGRKAVEELFKDTWKNLDAMTTNSFHSLKGVFFPDGSLKKNYNWWDFLNENLKTRAKSVHWWDGVKENFKSQTMQFDSKREVKEDTFFKKTWRSLAQLSRDASLLSSNMFHSLMRG